MNVTPAAFRTQLQGLLKRGYTAVPLTRLLAGYRAEERLPDKSFAVTFDDGFASVFHHAAPILRELQVPATVFLATAFLGQAEPFPFDRWGCRWAGQAPLESFRPMTLNECQAIQVDGLIALGTHTHRHENYSGRLADFRADMESSLAVLRSLGVQEMSFAFPFGRRHLGQVDDGMLAAAREMGLNCALTTAAEPLAPGSDPFGWGRFNVYEWDTGATLEAKLAGWYSWAPRLQEWWEGERTTP